MTYQELSMVAEGERSAASVMNTILLGGHVAQFRQGKQMNSSLRPNE